MFMLRADSLTGKIESMNAFKTFTRQASEIIRNAQYDENINIQPVLGQLCRNNSTAIPSVAICIGSKKVFVWPENTPYFSLGSSGGIATESLPLFCIRAQTTVPATAYSEPVVVHSVLQTVPISTLINRGQTVFFIVLTVSLLTLVLLIFSYLEVPSHTRQPEDEASSLTDESAPHTSDTEQLSGERLEIPPISVEEAQAPETASISLEEQIRSLNHIHIGEDDSAESTTAAEYTGTADIASTDGEPAAEGTPIAPHEQYPETAKGSEPTDSKQVNMPNPVFSPRDEEAEQGTGCLSPEVETTPVQKSADDSEKIPVEMSDQVPIQAESYGAFENSLKSGYIAKRNDRSAYEHSSYEMQQPAEEDSTHFMCTTTAPVGFYAKMLEDLQTALNETAVAEEDLTLLFISMPDIVHNESIVQSVRTGLDRINKFFFFDENTIGLIIYYTTLDNAMRIAVKLYGDITSLLLFSNSNLPLGIGITTRAGRLIPAYRMIEEAAAAIKKTSEPDSDPIVAFRVNPEKYRRCLAQIAENGAK